MTGKHDGKTEHMETNSILEPTQAPATPTPAPVAPTPAPAPAPTGEFNPLVSITDDAIAQPSRTLPAVQIVDWLRTGTHRPQVATIRKNYARVLAETGDPKAAKKAVDADKKKLPGIMFSGIFRARGDKNLEIYSQILCADVDGLAAERVGIVYDQLAGDPHCFTVAVSPSGFGVKALCPTTGNAEQHERSVAAMAKYFLETYGIEIDPSCKNLERLCFAPDNALDWNHSAVPFNPLPAEAKVGRIKTPAAQSAIQPSTRTQIAEKLLGPIQWTDENTGFGKCPGEHLHTTPTDAKHFMVKLDRAPTVTCFHGSCKGIIEGVNHQLRSQIAKAEQPAKPGNQADDELQRALADARPKIRLPGSDRLLSDFATELVHVLRDKEIYWRNGEIITLTGGHLKPMTPQTFRCWAEQFFVGYRAKTIGENTFEFNVTMTDNEARGTLAAPQFADALRRVRRMNHARLPVFGADGKLTLLPDGYHEPTQTLTLADVDFDLQMPMGDAVETINDLLAEFCFADGDRSKAVTIAAMTGVFANQLLPGKSLRPCFIFVGNCEGAGKSLLAQVCITPTLGAMPTGCKSAEDEEIRKILTTAILEGRLVVFFDNFKGKLSSQVLEAFLSAPIWTDRKLGFNESVTGENLATCFVTGNAMTCSPDMRRRSLFVELHLEAERAEDRKFNRLLDLPTLLEMRPKILAALWALVKHWEAKSRPTPSRGHSAFPSWANIIGGIIESAGFACCLETASVTAAADSDAADMRKLVSAMAEKPMPLSFADLVALAREHGLFENIIGTENEELGRREKSALSCLLTRYDRRMVLNFRFALDGKGHARRYRVENVHGDMVEHGVPADKSWLYAREP